MKKSFFTIFFMFILFELFGQDNNMLGKSFKDIFEKFNLDPEYYVRIDTVDNGKTITITCKKSSNYPYYYYEIDPESQECVCFCTVSKDRQVYDACLDLLSIWGKEISSDADREDFVYEVMDNTNQLLIYTVKQYKGDLVLMRNIFYIYVTRKSNSKNDY